MKLLTPDHRYQTVQKALKSNKAPKGGVEAALFSLIQGKKSSDEVVYAYDIYSSLFKREVIESFLLVEASPEEVFSILGVPENVTETYGHLFFDASVFKNELDRISYAYTYDRDVFGASMKKFAIDMGKESLKIKMGRGSYTVDPVHVQDGIRSTAYLMGQMIKANPMDSRMARESLNWAKLGLKAATSVEKEENVGDIDKVKIALEKRDETVGEKETGLKPDDIMH